MAEVRIERGCIRIYEEDSSFLPTAEEIFAIVFEGKESIRSIQVTGTDLLGTGLKFSEYTADPVVVLEADSDYQGAAVACRLIAKNNEFEAEVSADCNSYLDYAIYSGTWLPLPQGSLDTAYDLIRKAGVLEFGRISLAQYLTILRLSEQLLVEDRTHESLKAENLSTAICGSIPPGFLGTLYPYQEVGYNWLSYMCKEGLGAIIADEMGLGKTIQVICLLLEAKDQGKGPNLVIAPVTVLENWRRELSRFAPQLSVHMHLGSRRTGFPDDFRKKDVVATSFETATADVSLLRNLTWNIVVVDEAQGIRNPTAKRSIQLRTIPRRCAVAMTGTPVENRLSDLWSIADFVVPALLGSLQDFERHHPDTVDAAATLEPIVSPLILRRKVWEVAADLPPRIDIPQPLELDYESAQVYEALRATAAGDAIRTQASLMRLRMYCTHPWLAGQFTHVTEATACSVKLQRLLEVMEEIASEDGKVLVFTSFHGAIDLISHEIAAAFGIHADTIDGRTPVEHRQLKIDAFTALRSSAALILNPKAAGIGLNITAANHVIHFNLEWNPAVEDQASARAHRRGQLRPVTVHRFFYIDTVEDVINARMKRKREIASAAVVGTDGVQADIQDVIHALSISPVAKMPERQDGFSSDH